MSFYSKFIQIQFIETFLLHENSSLFSKLILKKVLTVAKSCGSLMSSFCRYSEFFQKSRKKNVDTNVDYVWIDFELKMDKRTWTCLKCEFWHWQFDFDFFAIWIQFEICESSNCGFKKTSGPLYHSNPKLRISFGYCLQAYLLLQIKFDT